jgi:hypothetical protein
VDISPIGGHIGRMSGEILNFSFLPGQGFEQMDQIIDLDDLMTTQVYDLVSQEL